MDWRCGLAPWKRRATPPSLSFRHHRPMRRSPDGSRWLSRAPCRRLGTGEWAAALQAASLRSAFDMSKHWRQGARPACACHTGSRGQASSSQFHDAVSAPACTFLPYVLRGRSLCLNPDSSHIAIPRRLRARGTGALKFCASPLAPGFAGAPSMEGPSGNHGLLSAGFPAWPHGPER